MTPRCTGGKTASPLPTTRFTCRSPLPGDFFFHLYIIDDALKSNRPSFFRSPAVGQLMVNSLLTISLPDPDDLRTYSCTVRNSSAEFRIRLSKTGETAQMCTTPQHS